MGADTPFHFLRSLLPVLVPPSRTRVPSTAPSAFPPILCFDDTALEEDGDTTNMSNLPVACSSPPMNAAAHGAPTSTCMCLSPCLPPPPSARPHHPDHLAHHSSTLAVAVPFAVAAVLSETQKEAEQDQPCLSKRRGMSTVFVSEPLSSAASPSSHNGDTAPFEFSATNMGMVQPLAPMLMPSTRCITRST